MAIHDKDAVQEVKRSGKEAAHKAKGAAYSPWMVTLARLGYFARGLIYVTMGALAFMAALHFGPGKVTNYQGAIATLGATQLGYFLLILILVGLIGYALWSFIRAFYDPLNKGNDLGGIAQRVGYFVSGIFYGSLVYPTWQLLKGNPGGASSGSNSSQHLTATVLSQPFGKWVVIAIGIILLVVGLAELYKAWKFNFEKQFAAYKLNGEELRFARDTARFGTAARGIVFLLVGIFFFQAGLYTNPNQVKGIDGALLSLLQKPYGDWLMGIVAAGLVAFGLYSLMNSWWFRMPRG